MHSWAAYALCELCTAADDHEVIMQHNTAAIVVGLMTLSSSLSLRNEIAIKSQFFERLALWFDRVLDVKRRIFPLMDGMS